MKRELVASKIQKMLRSGISKNQISSDYNVDEKLLDSFSKMVEIEKQFVIENLSNFVIRIENNSLPFKSLVNIAWANLGSSDYKPIWLVSKKNHQPWSIEINLSPNFVIAYSWQPYSRLLEPKDEYAKQLIEVGYIKSKVPNNNVSESYGQKIDEQKSEIENRGDSSLGNKIEGYDPFQVDRAAFDNQALTEVIDFTDVRKSVDADLKKDKDSAIEKEILAKVESQKEVSEEVQKKTSKRADKERVDKEKVDEEGVDEEKVDKESKKEDIKDNNLTTSLEKAEIGKGKTVKVQSERIPVPSWDDIILGGA
ncbi:MAG: DUF3071 domain-containing protein [Bifidobacteriaceae bacterium]|jgi:hypothetical protein|nr:DUF3071 domain-containing protein [Bifidobacteriaceae bacterium]